MVAEVASRQQLALPSLVAAVVAGSAGRNVAAAVAVAAVVV